MTALGGFRREEVEGWDLVCVREGVVGAAAAVCGGEGLGVSSSSPGRADFSLCGTFQVAISSSSMGEMPRAKRGFRPPRVLMR